MEAASTLSLMADAIFSSWEQERERKPSSNLSVILIYNSVSLTNVQCLIIRTKAVLFGMPGQILKSVLIWIECLVTLMMWEWPPHISHLNYCRKLMGCSFCLGATILTAPHDHVCEAKIDTCWCGHCDSTHQHAVFYYKCNNEQEIGHKVTVTIIVISWKESFFPQANDGSDPGSEICCTVGRPLTSMQYATQNV